MSKSENQAALEKTLLDCSSVGWGPKVGTRWDAIFVAYTRERVAIAGEVIETEQGKLSYDD